MNDSNSVPTYGRDVTPSIAGRGARTFETGRQVHFTTTRFTRPARAGFGRLACAIWIAIAAVGFTAPALSARAASSTARAAQDDPVSRPTIVAHLEIELPQSRTFSLRATLPIPAGTWDKGQPVPLTILAGDGTPRPTQLERVSRYPRTEDGADVVEIHSRVGRPYGKQPGDRHVYEVALQAPPSTTATVSPSVTSLLAQNTSLRLLSYDVFGHPYDLDLTEQLRQPGLRTPRRGPIAYQRVVHDAMTPVEFTPGPQGTYPHLMGVHAYMTQFADEDFVLLDLHVHNGLNGLDEVSRDDDLMNRLLFDRLLLRVPEDWDIIVNVEDPKIGAPFDGPGAYRTRALVRPEGGGQLHAMPRQARFIRRVAVAKTGPASKRAEEALKEHWLAFCRPGHVDGRTLWSWWNPETARYFPQNHPLPTLDHIGLAFVNAQLEGRESHVHNQIETGAAGPYPFLSQRLGWAHPWGVAYGGMAGGDEIHQLDGVRTAATASRAGYRLHQLTARSYASRHPTALYHLDGRPTRMEDLLVTEGLGAPYVATFFHDQRPGPFETTFRFSQGPSFQWHAAINTGRIPNYFSDLESWSPIDRQHLIRWTRTWKVLAWLGNDTLAKDLLTATGENFRLEFHPFPVEPYGFFQPTGLLDELHWVATHPGRGLEYRRGEAWGTDAAVCAYRFANDPARTRWLPWFQHIGDLVRDGQSACTGNLMSVPAGNVFGGNYRIRQAREEAFVQQALRAVSTSVFKGVDWARNVNLLGVINRSHYASIRPPFWPVGAEGAWATQAIGFADGIQSADWCQGGIPGTNTGYIADIRLSNSMAYAFDLTRDPIFLEHAQLLGPTNSLFVDQDAWGLYQLENRAALLALLQRFNGED
jgi:hypothetical protein